MADPIQYTVQQGDTLNGIASAHGYQNYKDAGITGYGANPDAINPGQVLSIAGGGPQTKSVPGIGNLTITPKAVPTTTPGAPEDLTGAYARAGLTPPAPAPGTGTGYTPPAVPGLPVYPSGVGSTSDRVAGIMKSYQDTLATITSLEGAIASSSTPSSEETALQKKLNDAKATLANFDVGTLNADEALHGQGRGATLGSINTQQTILDRTRALQRLGFSTDADTIATQLSTATAARAAQGQTAQTQYDLATKRLDLALGIQDKIDALSTKEQTNARQFLLDTVNFADGKTYDKLDPTTQQAIVHAVANSPITLDMVKTSLQSGADKAAAAALGNLRTVSGLGVVQINKDGTYKVVVPEHPSSSTSPGTHPTTGQPIPSFNDYAASQNLPIGLATPDAIAKLRTEYDAKYNNVPVNLGSLTKTNSNDLLQANLHTAQPAVQSYFLNAPSGFRDSYQRDVASGKIAGPQTIDAMVAAYTEWYNAQKSSTSGTHDWAALLGTKQ